MLLVFVLLSFLQTEQASYFLHLILLVIHQMVFMPSLKNTIFCFSTFRHLATTFDNLMLVKAASNSKRGILIDLIGANFVLAAIKRTVILSLMLASIIAHSYAFYFISLFVTFLLYY